MNRKWLKRSVIIGIVGILIFLFYEFLGADLLAKRRFLSDKENTIENFEVYKNNFEEIRIRSLNLPDFYLGIDNSLNKIISFKDRRLENSDTTIYFKNYSLILNKVYANTDSIFPKEIPSLKKDLSQFDTLFTLLKDVNCQSISKAKDHLKIVFVSGGFYNAGFRYICFYDYLNEEEYITDEFFIREKLNNHFYWEFYDESLICLLHPIWIPN